MSTDLSSEAEQRPQEPVEGSSIQVELRAASASYPYGDRKGWVYVAKEDDRKGVAIQFVRQTTHRDFKAGKLRPVTGSRLVRGVRVTELLVSYEGALELRRLLDSLLRGEDSHRNMSLTYKVTIPEQDSAAA